MDNNSRRSEQPLPSKAMTDDELRKRIIGVVNKAIVRSDRDEPPLDIDNDAADSIMQLIQARDEQREIDIRIDELERLRHLADHAQQFVAVRKYIKRRRTEIRNDEQEKFINDVGQTVNEQTKSYPRKYPALKNKGKTV